MSNSRRYEILIPLKFNNGDPVPWTLIGDALVDLKRRFSAVSWETQIIHGIWQHQETEFRDDLVRVFVDVEDKPENREFFRAYKEQLKSRFRQIEVWLTSSTIEVLSEGTTTTS